MKTTPTTRPREQAITITAMRSPRGIFWLFVMSVLILSAQRIIATDPNNSVGSSTAGTHTVF